MIPSNFPSPIVADMYNKHTFPLDNEAMEVLAAILLHKGGLIGNCFLFSAESWGINGHIF